MKMKKAETSPVALYWILWRFEQLEKALAFDSSDIEGIVNDIEVLKTRFIEMMEQAKLNYLILIKDKSQDKAVETILEYFIDEEKRHEYYAFFKEISNIYEILSPDAFLRPYIDDYETLTRFFRILREAMNQACHWIRYLKRDRKLVQEFTKSGPIKPALEVYEINEET